MLPGSTSTSAISNGSPLTPSGGPGFSGMKETVPSGAATAGGGCPAEAMTSRRDTGS